MAELDVRLQPPADEKQIHPRAMTTPGGLRFFVLLNASFLILFVAIGWFGDPFLDEDIRSIQDAAYNQPYSLWHVAEAAVAVVDLIIYVSALVCLWRLRPLGRKLYVTSCILAFALTIPINYVISSGPVLALEWAANFSATILLILPYTTPLKSCFDANHNTVEQGAAANP